MSIGKFAGAAVFGIFSDKYGRTPAFGSGVLMFVSGSIASTFTPWYWLFVIGRILLGAASSGLFYAPFSLRKHCDIKLFKSFQIKLLT